MRLLPCLGGQVILYISARPEPALLFLVNLFRRLEYSWTTTTCPSDRQQGRGQCVPGQENSA